MTHRPIHDWFGEVAARDPGRPAVERRGESFTYADLDARAHRIANYLRERGLELGARVMIVSDEVMTVLPAIIGALRAGGLFVPVDPRTPPRRLAAMAAEISATWFVTERKWIPLVAGATDGAAAPARILDLTSVEFEQFTDASRAVVAREPDDACYVYFTSGSTGRPKGIVGRLKAIDHFVRWEISTFGLCPGVRVSQLISPAFDAYLRDVFTPLCAGGTVCAPPDADLRFDAARLAAWLDEARVELVHCVPSMFRTLLGEPLHAGRFAALRHVLLSGEPLLPVDVRRWMDVFGDRIELVNLYGPSETTMTKFVYRVKPGDRGRSAIPIGVPMDGASALVLDDAGRPCARGVVGEIYIRTPYRSLGYYGRDDLTTEVFVRNPFGARADDLVYRTGDLARVLEDGTFELRGRRDHQVKIRGERVELAAIENALRLCDGVRDVAVVDRDDASGTKYLCAYVVNDGRSGVSDLKEGLAREFPPSMVPTAWVMLEALPRTVSGKVDRQLLPEPSAALLGRSADVAPPRSPVEQRVAGMFAEVLGVTSVGITDSFFELGGHSLLATQLAARVRRTFGVDLPVRVIFDTPTVADVARQVDELRRPVPLASGVEEIEL